MEKRNKIIYWVGAILLVLVVTSVPSFSQNNQDKTEKMKEYILLIRLPINYGQTQALKVREKWDKLTDQWKADNIFVTSFIFPSESYLVSGDNKVVTKEAVVSNDLKLISNIIVRASNFEEAVLLAKKCPIIDQGGTVEVREAQPRPRIETTTPEELKNKELIRNLYEDILNNRKLELLGDLISEDYIGFQGKKGAKGFSETVASVIAGFPNIKWTIEDLFADGDKVTVRWSWKGINTNSFRGFPASNNPVSDTAIVIYQLKDGKITNAWIQSDCLGVLMQIGVISPSIITPPSKK